MTYVNVTFYENIQYVKSGKEKYQDPSTDRFVKSGELKKDLDSAMIHFVKICWLFLKYHQMYWKSV